MSRWEDTVMTQYQKDCALKLFLKEHPQYKGLNLWKLVARHQAEISFKAGIKEVVGFLDKPCPHSGGLEEQQLRAIDCTECWQAQLKEWGINA